MATISVCMIVKNEEKVLRRCLDSLEGIYDELIIVDTGSTDSTKKIAKEYTDKIYNFTWTGDFSAARNFSMKYATCDYIYIADADEIIDEENRGKFLVLKKALVPEIEIVEMKYINQLEHGTVYNYDSELRPKLYKRLREFTFIEPVHEMVRLDPVVFESDVEIIHKPQGLHSYRDISIFENVVKNEGQMSDRLTRMYARELMVSGTEQNFHDAVPFFENVIESSYGDSDVARLAYIILAAEAATTGNSTRIMKYSQKDISLGASSEICSILGAYYETKGDLSESYLWYYNAAYNTDPEISIRYKEEIPVKGLGRIEEKKQSE